MLQNGTVISVGYSHKLKFLKRLVGIELQYTISIYIGLSIFSNEIHEG